MRDNSRCQVDWRAIWDEPPFYNLAMAVALVTPEAVTFRNQWAVRPGNFPTDMYLP